MVERGGPEFNIRNGGYYPILNAKLSEPVWLRAALGGHRWKNLEISFFRT